MKEMIATKSFAGTVELPSGDAWVEHTGMVRKGTPFRTSDSKAQTYQNTGLAKPRDPGPSMTPTTGPSNSKDSDLGAQGGSVPTAGGTTSGEGDGSSTGTGGDDHGAGGNPDGGGGQIEDKGAAEWPKHTGGGHFLLSNGVKVRGKEEALVAQAALGGGSGGGSGGAQ